jgi:hypothetical protein
MIKYLLTDDVILIPQLKIQLTKEDPRFNDTVCICKDPDAIYSDLNFLSPLLSYESDLISIEHQKDNEPEVYYDGKYFPIPKSFVDSCKYSMSQRSALSPKAVANFLWKILKNPNFKYDQLFSFLMEKGFLFLDNGNILVRKKRSDLDEKRINSTIEDVPTDIISFRDEFDQTLIEIDPSEINYKHKILNYKIRCCPLVGRNFLLNTYIRHNLISALEKAFSTDSVEDLMNSIKVIVSRDIEDILNGEQLAFLKSLNTYLRNENTSIDERNKQYQRIIDIIIRICQD